MGGVRYKISKAGKYWYVYMGETQLFRTISWLYAMMWVDNVINGKDQHYVH